MKKRILEICLISFFILFAAGCGGGSDSGSGDTGGTEDTGETEDTSSPLEISSLTATAGYETVALSWAETGDTGRVEITWSPDGTTAQTVQPGTGAYTATDLALGTEYTFTVTSIDGDEAVTAEFTAAATPYKEGAPANAVYISTVAGLKAIDDAPAGYYVLAADIDISGENWSPLGAETATRFEGTLDGNGHVITGLTINTSDDHQGLFGRINSDGIVESLGLENVSISGFPSVSGALAASNYGAISNCYSTGTVSGAAGTGGLVGYNYSGAISDSYSECDVNGDGYNTGGLVGRSQNGGVITNCFTTGTVSGGTRVGGLVGYFEDGGEISGCYTTGDVSGTYYQIGGLVGQSEDSDLTDLDDNVISDCYALGDVSADTNNGTYVGGLVGQNNYCDISDCHADGDVYAGKNYAGGLVGSNEYSAISNCYAAGAVGCVQYSAGGLVGTNTDGAIDSCFATGDVTCNTTNSNYVGGLVGRNQTGSTITRSFAAGNASGYSYIGGLIGYNDESDETADCYATGSATGTSDYIGGLVGYNYGADSDLTHCYSVGIAQSDDATATSVGGLVGHLDLSDVTSCYFNNDDNTDNSIGTATAPSAMKSQAVYADWDFADETTNGTEDIWSMDDSATDPLNSGYPYLTDLPPDE